MPIFISFKLKFQNNKNMKKLYFLTVVIVAVFASCTNKPSDLVLNVMSFNIRYDEPRDSLNNWQYRKDFAASLICFHDVDIVGAQEVLNNQLEDLKTRLPEYSTLGVGRLDGKTEGEYSSIFYKTSKFDVQKSGNFWLSEDINAVGKKGWDAACERIVTWAIFKDKATQKEFFFLNTHFDHIGEVARSESAKLILEKTKELSEGLPIIATGDYNAEPTSLVIAAITDKSNPNNLINARDIAKLVHGPGNSFHAYGNIPYEKRVLIDYIFVKGNVTVNRIATLTETYNATYLSDHYPVLATVVIENN